MGFFRGEGLPTEWKAPLGKLRGALREHTVGAVERDLQTFNKVRDYAAGAHGYWKGERNLPLGRGEGEFIADEDTYRLRKRDAIYDEETETHNYAPSVVAQYKDAHDQIKEVLREIEPALPGKVSTLIDDISFDPEYMVKKRSSFSAGEEASDPRRLTVVARDMMKGDAHLKLTLLHEFEHASDFDSLVNSIESVHLQAGKPLDRNAAIAQARAEFHPEPIGMEAQIRYHIQYAMDEVSVETRAFERLEKYFGKSMADEVRDESRLYIENKQEQIRMRTLQLDAHLKKRNN